MCFFVQPKMKRVTNTAILFTFSWAAACIAAPSWQSTITKEPPGNFPPLRPMLANYRFGWSGFTAASGEVHFTKPSGSRFQLEATGRTIGLVRALWRMDVTHHALADADTLHPIEMKQVETYRKKKLITELTFASNRVTSARTESLGGEQQRRKNIISRTCSIYIRPRSICGANLSEITACTVFSCFRPLRLIWQR